LLTLVQNTHPAGARISDLKDWATDVLVRLVTDFKDPAGNYLVDLDMISQAEKILKERRASKPKAVPLQAVLSRLDVSYDYITRCITVSRGPNYKMTVRM
jgi:hypothetical protein